MKVPQYQQQVDPQTTQLKEGNIPGLVIPRETFEGPNKLILSNIENAGKIAEGLGVALQKRAEQQSEAKNAELENGFMVQYQNLMHNPDQTATKTIKDGNNNDIQVPAGFGDRIGYQTQGMSTEHEQSVHDLLASTLSQQKNPLYRAKLQQSLMPKYLSGRESVMGREVEQIRLADMKGYATKNTNLEDSITENPALMLPTPEGGTIPNAALKLDEIKKNTETMAIRGGWDQEQTTKTYDESSNRAITNLGYTMIQQDIPLAQVNAFLDSPEMSDRIPKSQRSDINDKLSLRAKRRAQELKWGIKQVQTQGAFDLSQQLIDGSLTPDSIKTAQQVGAIDSDTAAIYDSVVRNINITVPTQTSLGTPDYFLRQLDKTLKNPKESLSVIRDATKAYGAGKMGKNQYVYFMQGVKQKIDRERNGLLGWHKHWVDTANAVKSISDWAKSTFDTSKEESEE